MANVVVVGAQWGDEGKGKIVDWLSVGADVVVRFQGGHNAGHTLVIDGKTFKLALLPSGIVRPGKLSVIGNGVVLDPYHLVEEIGTLRAQGVEVTPANLKIAENVPLILSLHRELDAHRESGARAAKIGTTKRGIGPAYEDKVARRAIRLMDLADPESLDDKIARLLAHHDPLWRGLGLDAADADAIRDELMAIAPKVLPFMAPTFDLLDRERRAGKRILFEGAQGALLDVDHGTYPYVTSSNTVAANAATGSGLGPGHRLCARHRQSLYDAGRRRPVPDRTRQRDRPAIGERGREFGTNTGRPRRCGWFDAVLARQAVRTCGIDGLALTKLDILDGFETSRSRPVTGWTARRSTICRPRSPRRRASSRFTRRSKAGRARRARRGHGPTCRRRRSNTCGASRNWSARRSPYYRRVPSATTRFLSMIRFRTKGPSAASRGAVERTLHG